MPSKIVEKFAKEHSIFPIKASFASSLLNIPANEEKVIAQQTDQLLSQNAQLTEVF